MNTFHRVWAVSILLLAAASHAAMMTGSGTRETLFESTELGRWSVGGDYVVMKRDISSDWLKKDLLKIESYGVYAGYRPLEWLTLQGEAAVPKTDISDHSFNDGDFCWGLGLQANLWRYDLADPDFLNGRYSLRSGLDYRSGTFDDEIGDGDWQEFSAGLWLHYESFVDRMTDTERHPFSLALFAGPLFSTLSGSTSESLGTGSFDERTDVGVGGGVELHVSHNFILGMTIEHFDHASYRWSMRYRF